MHKDVSGLLFIIIKNWKKKPKCPVTGTVQDIIHSLIKTLLRIFIRIFILRIFFIIW